MRVFVVSLLALCVCGIQAAELEIKIPSEEELAPVGLFYQIEDWAQPKDAWVEDQIDPRKWSLTRESGPHSRTNNHELALQGPAESGPHTARQEGAPPLHVQIKGVPAGIYMAFLNDTAQAVSVSFNGEEWSVLYPSHPGFEIPLGVVDISGGSLELWLDDDYEVPYQSGPAYLDYLRLIPVGDLKVSRLATTVLGNGQTRIAWLTNAPVPAFDLAISDEVGRVVRFNTEGPPKTSHELLVPDLRYGEQYTARVTMRGYWGDRFESDPIPFVVKEPEIPSTKPKKVLMKVDRASDAIPVSGTPHFPVRSGIPFAKGILAQPADVLLASATSGFPIPAQYDVLSRWEDGSVRWLLADFLAPVPDPPAEGEETKSKYLFVVRPEGGEFNPVPEQPASAQETKDALILDTGYLVSVIDKKSPSLPGTVFFDKTGNGRFTNTEKVLSGESEEGLFLTDGEGRRCRMGPVERIDIEDPGPVRVSVRLRGSFVGEDGHPFFRYDCRITCWAGTSLMKLEMTLGNDVVTQDFSPVRSWELSLPVEDVSGIHLAGKGSPSPASGPISVLQDDDTHCVVTANEEIAESTRLVGAVALTSETATLNAFLRDFWQAYPKGLSADSNGLSLHLLPPLSKDQYESTEDSADPLHRADWCRNGEYLFRLGMQYTAEVFLRWDEEKTDEGGLLDLASLCQDPPFAVVPPAQYCSSGAFGLAIPAQEGFFPKYEAMVTESFAMAEGWRAEGQDYGWCNYGDLFDKQSQVWSNNTYDLTWSWILQFARTGDLLYLRRAAEMAKHSVDIDTVHDPGGLKNGTRGIVNVPSIGHAGTSVNVADSQREYSGLRLQTKDHALVETGFDPFSDSFQQGNYLAGFLLGERRYIEEAEASVRRLSTFLVPQLLSCGNEYFDTAQTAGWPLINLVAAYESTGNNLYLNSARSIVDAVIERQDPQTGMVPFIQHSEDCGCAQPHFGGRPSAVGILLRGLMDVHRVDPDPKLETCIVKLVDWLVDSAWDEEKGGFRHLVPCPQFEDLADDFAIPLLTVHAFPFAYEHTGSARYSNFAVRMFGRAVQGRPEGPRDYGQSTRHGAAALYDIYRWGIKELP